MYFWTGVQFSSAPPKRKSGFAETQTLFSFLATETQTAKSRGSDEPRLFCIRLEAGRVPALRQPYLTVMMSEAAMVSGVSSWPRPGSSGTV